MAISGAVKVPTTDYTLAGTTLTFTSAPTSGTDNIFCRWYSAYSGGVPNDGSVTAAKLAPGAVTAAKLSDGLGIPAGQVGFLARNTPPTGWLKANGAAVSRTTYTALFAAIGTTFGAGDGSTTFNLPDLRGEFNRGWDDGRGVDSGRVFGSWQDQAYLAHSHTVGEHNNTGSVNTNPAVVQVGASQSAALGTGATGSSGGAETRPRNTALLACIKY